MFYREHFDDDDEDDEDDDDVAVLSLASSRSADSDQGYGSALPVVGVSRSESAATWSAHDPPSSAPLLLASPATKTRLSKQFSSESRCTLLQPCPSDYNRTDDAFDLSETPRPRSAAVSRDVIFQSSSPTQCDTSPSSADSEFMTTASQDGGDIPPSKKKAHARPKRPDSAQRLLSRRQFHRGNYFVRARYGAHPRAAENPTKQTNFRPPSAFCAPLRYAQEPRAMKAREQKPKCPRWPEPPRYPPKARHVGVDCNILRLVEQLHVAVQCQPEVTEAAVWCALRMVDGSTQYPRIKYKDASVQTTIKMFSDQGVQNKPTTKNRMVETSERILYLPEFDRTQATTQCVSQTDSADQ